VRIELLPLRYERVSFVTPEGTPVPVAGRSACAVFARQPIYESFYNVGKYEVSWLPSQVDVGAVGANELVYITAKFSGNAVRNRDGSVARRVVDFQGYDAVEISFELLPLDQWPRGREIVLRPDPSEAPAVPHRVVFPDVAAPEGWADDSSRLLEIIASVTAGTETCWVTQRHPVFRLPRGTDFRFGVLGGTAALGVDLRDEGEEIRVLVDWPRYAFLDLRYPPRHPSEPLATASVSVWSAATQANGGRLVEPGRARFAYLPEGAYFAEFYWWKADQMEPFSSWRTRAPMNLAMGLNTFEVNADDVVAGTSR
jgi:hypothetical protein